MNLVFGGRRPLNILLKFLKKAMALTLSQVCQRIGLARMAVLPKRLVLTLSDGNVPKIKGRVHCR